MTSQRFAVVGGGVAGLTAAWLLDQVGHVELFEASDRLGGNAYSYRSRDGHDVELAVASFGRRGYPTFFHLLDRLGVPTDPIGQRYLSVHEPGVGGGIYITPTLMGLWTQRFGLLRPGRLHDLWRLLRLVGEGTRRARAGSWGERSLREALAELDHLAQGDSGTLLLCAFSLLSSMRIDQVLDAPAAFFFGKLVVHDDALSPLAARSWRTIRGRTRRYVDALAAPLGERVQRGVDVSAVRRVDGGVELDVDGVTRRFDRVVIATGADQALGLLEAPTELEQRVLGPWRYNAERLCLHRDHSAFPARPLQQAYTFVVSRDDGRWRTSVNGILYHLHGVSDSCDLIASQAPNFPIREDLIELDTELRTPVFDAAAVATQRDLPRLNESGDVLFCGSYFGYGLHEDAVASAVVAARRCGAEL